MDYSSTTMTAVRRRAGFAKMFSITTILLIIKFGIPSQASAFGIDGSLQPCLNEGEFVPLETFTSSNCFSCICRNGYVECHQEHCSDTHGCYALISQPEDSCCRHTCKGCTYLGKTYRSGETIPDEKNPCLVRTCRAGVLTETIEECYVPCGASASPPLNGECCSTCPGCRINGQYVKPGHSVSLVEDPCVVCHCQEQGRLNCTKRACPALNCPARNIEKPGGSCCPVCSKSRPELYRPPSGECTMGLDFHKSGSTFQPDRCTTCTCMNSTVLCKKRTCPPLDCPEDAQVPDESRCCKRCQPAHESRTSCTVGGNTYEDGQIWHLSACKWCSCRGGQARCAVEKCPPALPCPPGQKLLQTDTDCCPRCVENDGVCTVFGDPHYRTFDGRFFSFQGHCKYLLTADCEAGSFSIRVTNDPRNTRNYAWTKTVSIKVGDMKVTLGQRSRVKVNSKRVTVPLNEKRLLVERKDDLVVAVMNDVGVKVSWDGNNFLEVAVPAAFKNRTCGLCGNFNSIVHDDMKTRRGRHVKDARRLGASWRVGGRRACTKPAGRRSQYSPVGHKVPVCAEPKNPGMRLRAFRRCKLLKSDTFANCNKKVSPNSYFDACIMDSCECERPECACAAFTAYAHECKRHGVTLPNWRVKTECPPSAGMFMSPEMQSPSSLLPRRRPGSLAEAALFALPLSATRTPAIRRKPPPTLH